MNGLETLDSAGKILALIANVVVAAVCWRGYLKTRISPLLILAISAVLAFLALVFDLFFLRSAGTQGIFSAYLLSIMILWIVDVIFYTIGICLLVLYHLRPAADTDPTTES